VLDGLRITRISAQDTRLVVSVVASNPNEYDLAMSSLEAEMNVDGETLFTATLAAPVTLPANAETRVEIEARTGFLAIMTALERFSRQRTVSYELAGSAVVQNGWRLPFRRRGELPGAQLLAPRS